MTDNRDCSNCCRTFLFCCFFFCFVCLKMPTLEDRRLWVPQTSKTVGPSDKHHCCFLFLFFPPEAPRRQHSFSSFFLFFYTFTPCPSTTSKDTVATWWREGDMLASLDTQAHAAPKPAGSPSIASSMSNVSATRNHSSCWSSTHCSDESDEFSDTDGDDARSLVCGLFAAGMAACCTFVMISTTPSK